MISAGPPPYLMDTPKNLYDRGVGENLDSRDDKVRNNQDGKGSRGLLEKPNARNSYLGGWRLSLLLHLGQNSEPFLSVSIKLLEKNITHRGFPQYPNPWV